MKKLYVIFALILIIIVGLLYISLRLGVSEKIGDFMAENFQQDENDDNDDDSNDDPVTETDTRPSGYQTAEGEGGGSSGGSNSSSECILRKISYSLEDFDKTSVCNTYDGPVCIDKTVACSVSVRNLDYDLGGEFEIRTFYSIAGYSGIYATESQNKTIQPRTLEEFSSSVQIQGPEANPEVTCNFETGDTPEREVCP